MCVCLCVFVCLCVCVCLCVFVCVCVAGQVHHIIVAPNQFDYCGFLFLVRGPSRKIKNMLILNEFV